MIRIDYNNVSKESRLKIPFLRKALKWQNMIDWKVTLLKKINRTNQNQDTNGLKKNKKINGSFKLLS